MEFKLSQDLMLGRHLVKKGSVITVAEDGDESVHVAPRGWVNPPQSNKIPGFESNISDYVVSKFEDGTGPYQAKFGRDVKFEFEFGYDRDQGEAVSFVSFPADIYSETNLSEEYSIWGSRKDITDISIKVYPILKGIANKKLSLEEEKEAVAKELLKRGYVKITYNS